VARQALAALDRLDITVAPPGLAPSGPTIAGNLRNDWLWFRTFVLRQKAPQGEDAATAVVGDEMVVQKISPMHGPEVRSSVAELLRCYRAWAEAQLQRAEEAKAAVIYASAYGNTATLAEALCRGLTKAGVAVESVNCEHASVEEVEAALQGAQGLCIGSPTLGGHVPTPVQEALGLVLREVRPGEVPAGVFGSFGWSGEAVDILEGKLRDAGFDLAFESIRCKFTPTMKTIQVCEESGTDLAQAMRKSRTRQAAKQKRTLAEGGTAEAVGRIVGSLCILTCRAEDAASALLASWVSQAAFNPPALTVAVAKERAAEGLIFPGSKVAINVLAEGQEKAAMKHFLSPFKPGEDRFEGVACEEAANGCMVLTEAACSYLECTVMDKMEAGDHWVVLCQVDDGALVGTNSSGDSAVHFRRTGASY